MKAAYNWGTGTYQDGGKDVSWEEVQQQYGIGQSKAGNTTQNSSGGNGNSNSSQNNGFRWPEWTFGIPVLGSSFESGNNLADGNYFDALANFGTSLAELFTLSAASEVKIGTAVTSKTVSLDNNALIAAIEQGEKDAVKKAIGKATPVVSR